MTFISNVYKTGKNKFDIDDTVLKNGISYRIMAVYNDFAYLIIRILHIKDNKGLINYVPHTSSDDGFFNLPLSRRVLCEKSIFRVKLSDFAKAKMEEMLL